MSKIEQLSERLTALHLEMERRFGQLRTLLLLISCAVVTDPLGHKHYLVNSSSISPDCNNAHKFHRC